MPVKKTFRDLSLETYESLRNDLCELRNALSVMRVKNSAILAGRADLAVLKLDRLYFEVAKSEEELRAELTSN